MVLEIFDSLPRKPGLKGTSTDIMETIEIPGMDFECVTISLWQPPGS
jgi:hypothetical protein